MKELILRDLTKPKPDETYIIGGLPMRICKFARARRCKLFQAVASFGYCAAQKQTYYGLEGQEMAIQGIKMHTPLRDNMKDEKPHDTVKLIMDKRRYIETIIGKLVEQFNLVQNKARDVWRLSNKIYRKLLSYTCALQFHGSTRFLDSRDSRDVTPREQLSQGLVHQIVDLRLIL